MRVFDPGDVPRLPDPGDPGGAIPTPPDLPTADRVVRWTVNRGRQTEFDRNEAGTGTITLLNRDGLFDPLNADSPYASTLLPLRQTKITAKRPGTSIYKDVFTGYVERWSYERIGPRHAEATVELVDGFEPLSRAQIQPQVDAEGGGQYYALQHVNDRIKAALADAGWPAVRTSIFSGNVWVQPITYPIGTSMLQVCQDAADAEFPGVGNFYMDKAGRACFRGRGFRFDPFNTEWNVTKPIGPGGSDVQTSRAAKLYRFGDDAALQLSPTLLPIKDLTWTYDKDHVYNSTIATPANLDDREKAEQRKTDSVSIGRYGRRDLDIQDLIVAFGDDGSSAVQECRKFALHYLQNYKWPKVRANQLTVRSKFENADLWDFLLDVELGDICELWTMNPGGGGFDGAQFYIDGISHTVEAVGDDPDWTCTVDLSPLAHYRVGAVLDTGSGSGGGGTGGGPYDPGFPLMLRGRIDDGTSVIRVEYDRQLDPAHVPPPDAWRIVINGTTRALFDDPSAVQIDGSFVLLTLSFPVAFGDTIMLTYDPGAFPDGNTDWLRDITGEAAVFTTLRVEVRAETPVGFPDLTGVTVNASLVTLNYSYALDTGRVPGPEQFAIWVNGSLRSVFDDPGAIRVIDQRVEIDLSFPVASGDTVYMRYTPSYGVTRIASTTGVEATYFEVGAENTTP